VARYRLRFVLQEFDLPRGVTVIGRSLDCHLTIEDPLVSRKHARLIVSDAGAQIEDLSSRNGVKVNGAPIGQPTVLRNGDRLRIGTQELVFSRVDEGGRGAHSRTTGQLRLCANCRQPYPREMIACPSCEATEQTDDETLTATGSGSSQRWTMQLFVEALERALRLGRIGDAEQLARRATTQVDELLAAGTNADTEALGELAMQVAATTLVTNDPTWAIWAVEVYARCAQIPPPAVVERFAAVAEHHPDALRPALADLLARVRPTANDASSDDLTTLARLEELGNDGVLDDVAPPDWR
jgi:FHA domain